MPVEMTASEALGLWHKVTLEQVRRDGPDLTLRQLHELLWYLTEALTLQPARPLHGELRLALDETERARRCLTSSESSPAVTRTSWPLFVTR